MGTKTKPNPEIWNPLRRAFHAWDLAKLVQYAGEATFVENLDIPHA